MFSGGLDLGYGVWNDLKEVMDLGNYGYPDSGCNSAWLNLHEATPPASSLGVFLVPLPAKSENSQVSLLALKASLQLASSFSEAATRQVGP